MAETNNNLKIIAGAGEFGCSLKNSLVSYLESKGVDVEDLGTGKYYSIGEEIGRRISQSLSESGPGKAQIKGLVTCGTGVGVAIFANKFPGIYAATCNSIEEAQNCRSINNSNVLAVGGMKTTPEEGKKILDAWLETPFKSPCPASENKPWPTEIQAFLDATVIEMASISSSEIQSFGDHRSIYSLSENREFSPLENIPGASMKIVKEKPTSAIMRFKAGSVEPAHHHSFGYELLLLSGSKRVWNMSKNECIDLGPGDYLYMRGPDVHRAYYFTDTEFFIRFEGQWDFLSDEDLETAAAAVKNDLGVSN